MPTIQDAPEVGSPATGGWWLVVLAQASPRPSGPVPAAPSRVGGEANVRRSPTYATLGKSPALRIDATARCQPQVRRSEKWLRDVVVTLDFTDTAQLTSPGTRIEGAWAGG